MYHVPGEVGSLLRGTNLVSLSYTSYMACNINQNCHLHSKEHVQCLKMNEYLFRGASILFLFPLMWSTFSEKTDFFFKHGMLFQNFGAEHHTA